MKSAPKAWRPSPPWLMEAGDGLVFRLRPRLARLSGADVLSIAMAALAHGNGILEFTRWADLKIRGITEKSYPSLLDDLAKIKLHDAANYAQSQCRVIVNPFWSIGDDSVLLAKRLAERVRDLPKLPPNFGFAVDAGPVPVLGHAPADIRIERAPSGRLILRADGARGGSLTTRSRAVDDAVRLAHWFFETGGYENRKMSHHLTVLPSRWHPPVVETSKSPEPPLAAGETPLGPAVGIPFGRIPAHELVSLVIDSRARGIRLTPWQLIVLEGGKAVSRQSD